jgi:crotonobetainyl-CoA hydratase
MSTEPEHYGADVTTVLLERRGHIGLITLNRPEALNAVNARLSTQLGEAVDECVNDAEIRVILLRGAGRAFCTGHDLKAFAAGEDVWAAHHPQWGYAGITRRQIDKPIIVAAQGYMLGAGLEIGLASDIILATPALKLGLPEVQRGLFAAAGGVPRLAQQLPPHIAAWLIYSGELMDAETGVRWGLVNEIVEEDRLLERALEVAERIASNAPLAVQASKRMVRSLSSGSTWTAEAWGELTSELTVIQATNDAAEGAAAFTEGRDPTWSGS